MNNATREFARQMAALCTWLFNWFFIGWVCVLFFCVVGAFSGPGGGPSMGEVFLFGVGTLIVLGIGVAVFGALSGDGG